MKIKTIKIYNFASYYKEHVINFDQKLNLVGGYNGDGKTSLLKAFKWGLFGARLFNSNHVTNNYSKFLYDSLNNSDHDNKAFYVELFLEDNSDKYYIKRSVTFTNEKLRERVEYRINDKKVTNIALLDKYNPEIMEAVFFDGEDIINVINNDKFIEYVHSIIVELFDLKLFSVLKKDLEVLQKRNINEFSDDIYIGKKSRTDILKKQKNEFEQKCNTIDNKLIDYQQKLQIVNDEMASHGILNNTVTKDLSNKMENLKLEQQKIVIELKKFYTNEFLLILQHKALENTVLNLRATRQERQEKLNQLYENFSNDIEIDYNLERKFENKYETNIDRNYILKLIERNKQIDYKITKIKSTLSESTTGNEYNSLVNNCEYLEEEIRKLKIDSKNENTKLEQIKKEHEKAHIEFEIEEQRLLKMLRDNNAAIETSKVANLVTDYITIQTSNVYDLINNEVNHVYNSIKRKKNYITNIELTKHSALVTTNGKVVNLLTISSGEKQTVILAILFTILKVSKTNLPLVLDTFLGRLDGTHSINLLKFITNELENQVVILATDKEITPKEYNYLSQISNNEITLTNKNNRTKIAKGFFNYENKNN